MICPNCKLNVKGAMQFCPRCGAPLPPPPPRPQPEGEPNASKAAQVGYEAYRAFSSALRVFFGVYFLLILSQTLMSQLGAYALSGYSMLWSSRMSWVMLLILVGAVLQFVFALFLRGKNWSIASLAATGALCLLGLVLTLLAPLPDYLPAEIMQLAAEGRFACAIMLGMGVPMVQGALSFCRASYKSTALRFLLVEVVWFVLSLVFLYFGIFLFDLGVRGVALTILAPIAALAVSLILNRRVFRAASRPAAPQATAYQQPPRL